MISPTQSVPGGFLLIFFGLLCWVWAGLACYAGWLIHHKETIEHKVTGLSYGLYFSMSGGAFAAGLLLLIFGFRLARRVSSYDTRDPDQPSLKW